MKEEFKWQNAEIVTGTEMFFVLFAKEQQRIPEILKNSVDIVTEKVMSNVVRVAEAV